MRRLTTHSKLFLASALLIALLCGASSVCAQQATFTITGRVTDQSTGQPISGVAIAGVGNQTGAKVAITDSQQKSYTLPVEDLRKVTDTPWLSQLTVRLPSELSGASSITITVTARGQTSNAAKLRLK